MICRTITMTLTSAVMYRLWCRALLCLALVILPVQAWSRIYLVAVGVSDYPGVRNDLRLPHNDAATIEWLYKENKHAETVLLMNDKATLSGVKSAMSRLYSMATAKDIVVLFFSGHGLKGGFVCYDGVLRYSDIRRLMSASKGRSKMIFADTCYSGAFRKEDNRNGGGWKGTDIMLFLSCRTNEKSIEQKNMTNGFFTYALQHGLRGGADTNRDRIVTARELYVYVSAMVRKMSGNMQHPVMWGKFSDNMVVMKW